MDLGESNVITRILKSIKGSPMRRLRKTCDHSRAVVYSYRKIKIAGFEQGGRRTQVKDCE